MRAFVLITTEIGAMEQVLQNLKMIRARARSIQAFDRMLNLVPSDNIGLLFCQGCFAEMGVDIPAAIRHFGKQNKIFFAHFRNVKGAVPIFQETL